MRYNVRLNSVTISMNRLFLLSILFPLLLSVACTRSDGDFKLPGVYRISVMQGNVIEQDMLDRLKPGMEKHQVKFIMGTPTIIDPFHPDRWDYIYTFTHGAEQRHQRHLTLYFEDGKLAYLDGDVVTSIRKPPESLKKSKIVEVPYRETKPPGLIDSVLQRLPFVGKDEPASPPQVMDNENNDGGQAEQQTEPQTAQPAGDSEPAADDSKPAAADDSKAAANEDKATNETDQQKKKGFFSSLLDKLPFGGDDKKDKTAADSQQ